MEQRGVKRPRVIDESDAVPVQASSSCTPRRTESEQQRTIRLIRHRERYRQLRASESNEQREIRLQKKREKNNRRRNLETPEQRRDRLDSQRKRDEKRRDGETAEEREERLSNQRIRDEQRRDGETTGGREQRLNLQRMRDEERRNLETVDGRERRRSLQNLQNNLRSRTNLQANVGNMSKFCPHCDAKLFVGETAHFCCMNGKVRLPELNTLPGELQQLYNEQSEVGRHFRKHLRQYNSLYKMTSFACKKTNTANRCNPSVVIQGQIHH